MILRGIAKRYAVALFDAAVKQDIADQVHDDLTAFVRLLDDTPALWAFLSSPQVLTEEKQRLVTETFGDRTAGLFVKFLLLLIEKKRLDQIADISKAYTYLYEQLRGVLEVEAVTAVELDADLERRTVEKLERETGKTIRLVKTVDPSIIGGMILVMEDRVIDGSIRHHLDEMRRALRGLRVH